MASLEDIRQGYGDKETKGKEIVFYDDDGGSYHVVDVDGFYLPVGMFDTETRKDWATNLDILDKMEVRDDDVVIIGYPRCGTHWVHEMANMLLLGAAETISMTKEMNMIDVIPLELLAKRVSPRVMNTHYPPQFLPMSLLSKMKIIFLIRNPKDTFMSWNAFMQKMKHHKHNGTFENSARMFLAGKVACGSWFDYMLSYEELFNTHPELSVFRFCYEDAKSDTLATVKKLATFLDVDVEEEILIKISEKCQFDRMKEDNKKNRVDITRNFSPDGESLMYRKAVVGDWKNYFTVALNEEFDKVAALKMAGFPTKLIYEL